MSRPRTAVAAVAAAVVVALVLVVGWAALRPARPPPESVGSAGAVPPPVSVTSGAAVTGEVSPTDQALVVLHDWDSRRAAAYASGSAAALRALYAPGSVAGTADVRLLQRYASRGLRVVDLQTQVLSVAVTEHRADQWTLRVTDRLADGVAVHGAQRTQLPRDTSSTQVVTLVRGDDGRWRVSRLEAPVRRARTRDAS